MGKPWVYHSSMPRQRPDPGRTRQAKLVAATTVEHLNEAGELLAALAIEDPEELCRVTVQRLGTEDLRKLGEVFVAFANLRNKRDA
ncbi:MAG TPA: hypothetical protein DEA08_25140 [Planctomycetes bacterium]|nr:hypothetical protein [Planctomycetota bacterium]